MLRSRKVSDSVFFEIHRSRIDVEEMRSGITSSEPKDVPFYQALNDPDTRAEYIRRMLSDFSFCVTSLTLGTDLQILQWWTEVFVTAITQSTRKMPYGMRFLARETLLFVRVSNSGTML